MPAPSFSPPSGLQASSLTSSPFYSPMYSSSAHYEEKESQDADSGKQRISERQQAASKQWRPQLSPLMLAASPATQAVPAEIEVEGGEWTLSPIQTHQAALSASHRPATPMSPLVLPLSTSPQPPPRSQARPHSAAPASSARHSSAAPHSVSSPFASMHPSPSFHPSPYHLSPTSRPQHATHHQLDSPPSRPSASPRLSGLMHSAARCPPSRPLSASPSRGSLSDVCPSPLLSPITSPSLHSQCGSGMPRLSLDQQPVAQHAGRVRHAVRAADREDGMHSSAVERPNSSPGQPSPRPAASRPRPARSPTGSRVSQSSLSWLRSSRLLLFVAVVTGVVLFQLLCAVWLLPSFSPGSLTLQRSASLSQLERSRQSASSFQQSHAGHMHSQHRDDEALRQAVADMQEHVRSHNNNNNNNNDKHRQRQAPHMFEREVDSALNSDGAEHELEQQSTELQQHAIEPIDADESWK